MKNTITVIFAESLKIRRSKIFLITVLLSVFVPLIMGFMIFIAKNPDLAYKFGLLGTKATVLNLKADWPTYLGLLNMAIVGIGLVMFGFITSWVFGREYSDHTMKDLLALPVPRSSIVIAKFLVIAVWCAFLTLVFFAFGMFAGAIVQIPGWSNEIFFHGFSIFAGASLLTILLGTPVAFFVSLGRGYLSPMGFVLLALMASQFVGALGFAQYFPWSIPMLYAGGAGTESAQLGVISYIILLLTSISGLIGTLVWWRLADQY
jgi:ABC-2 type transport system permease protein